MVRRCLIMVFHSAGYHWFLIRNKHPCIRRLELYQYGRPYKVIFRIKIPTLTLSFEFDKIDMYGVHEHRHRMYQLSEMGYFAEFDYSRLIHVTWWNIFVRVVVDVVNRIT